MWFIVVSIPPVLVIVGTWFGFVIWRKAGLRSREFSLPRKKLHELSVDDVKPKVDLMTSRLAWFATALVFLLSSVFGVLVSVVVILEMRRDSLGRSLIIGSSFVTAIMILVFWIKRSRQHLGPRFLDKLMRKTSERTVSPRWIGFFNGFAFAAIAFIVGGSCSVIASLGRSSDEVNRQVSDLGMLLFAGAVFLVASVLEINQLHRWSGVVVSEHVRPEIHNAAAVMAGTVGLLFSFMLAATYVPAVVVLQYRAAAVNQSVGSNLQNAFRIAVVLSPLLVGLGSSLWSSSSFGQPSR
jgi:hypothetical protein